MPEETRSARVPHTVASGELPRRARRALTLGAASAAIAVAAGAFGAHALRDRVDLRLLEVFETGARYQMYHAFGLITVAMLLGRIGDAGSTSARERLAVAAGRCFIVGTILFSGSLYAMSMTGFRALGAITPVGGLCFIAGWVCLAVAAGRAD